MKPAPLDATFAALADPTRRAMLARLARGEATVSELARPFGLALPTISKHLAVLERARLIEKRKEASRRRCRLRTASLKQASDWIGKYTLFWESAFDSLEEFVHRKHVMPAPSRRRRK
ncbi:MAG: ArsR/SmtB family transcription factor [Candidatus Binataceae bacterium]